VTLLSFPPRDFRIKPTHKQPAAEAAEMAAAVEASFKFRFFTAESAAMAAAVAATGV
jgi:hypothetical protein